MNREQEQYQMEIYMLKTKRKELIKKIKSKQEHRINEDVYFDKKKSFMYGFAIPLLMCALLSLIVYDLDKNSYLDLSYNVLVGIYVIIVALFIFSIGATASHIYNNYYDINKIVIYQGEHTMEINTKSSYYNKLSYKTLPLSVKTKKDFFKLHNKLIYKKSELQKLNRIDNKIQQLSNMCFMIDELKYKNNYEKDVF